MINCDYELFFDIVTLGRKRVKIIIQQALCTCWLDSSPLHLLIGVWQWPNILTYPIEKGSWSAVERKNRSQIKPIKVTLPVDIAIRKASIGDSQAVSELVTQLLLELDPAAQQEVKMASLAEVASYLMVSGKIISLLALNDRKPIGVLNLHEGAAVYAGGVFGTISELYVVPGYRSMGIGRKLILAAKKEAANRNWKRLEVGAPGKEEHPASYTFYLDNGFSEIGPRLRTIL